jgi:ribosomal protein L30/L7E
LWKQYKGSTDRAVEQRSAVSAVRKARGNRMKIKQVEELVRDMLRSTAKYLPEGWKKYL